MTDPCKELKARLLRPDWHSDRGALVAWLDQAVEIEGCIAAGLAGTILARQWSLFEPYVYAAYCRPSRLYTATLCEVLDQQSDEVNNEDIVDVLAEIRDPSSVASLEGTLRWQPQWDEFHQLAIKSVWALAAVGTSEAIGVLREAASCEAAEIRSAAQVRLREGLWRLSD